MRALLTVALLFSAASVAAQPAVVARVSVGVDQHGDVGGVGAWQDRELSGLAARGIAAQPTDAFPAYVAVEAAVGVVLGAVEAGIVVGHSTTGGRIAYADYSGTFVADRTAERTAVGVYVAALPLAVGPVAVGGGLTARVSPTTVTYRRRVVLGAEEVEAADADLKAAPFSLEPAVLAEAAVAGPVRVRARLGYELSQSAGLDAPTLPADASAQDVGVGWSGLRASVGVGVRF